jgi:2'-hydroxyisoflavone reductase
MRILILGGTRFLGRHLAVAALARGHSLTLLHRGQSGHGLFPQAEHLIADRNGTLDVLAKGTWDVAIDTNAYVPRHVRSVAMALQGRIGHYQLVSSISAYASLAQPGTAEDAPLATLADPTVEAITGETYGGLKALCETEALQAFGPAACCLVRPGLLVGPFDPTDRWTWWVQRILRGGDVLAPGTPEAPVQFIDARDAATWMLDQAERGTTGPYNLTGPAEPLTMGRFLDTACATLQPSARLRWVDEAFVLGAGVAPWSDLPVWLPHASQALHQADIRRALVTGLQCRPLAQTLRDTAAWVAEPAAPPAPTATAGPARPAVGLDPGREAALLAAWAAGRPAQP